VLVVHDPFLLYVVGVAIYAIIWAYYGLIHMRAPREGIFMVGYGAVALSTVATLVFLVAAFVR
jgi:hypothetical protein